MAEPTILSVHPDDDVLVALRDLEQGTKLLHNGKSIIVQETVHHKHKIAARDFQRGDAIHMYGVTVGTAASDIPCGAAITTANVEHASDAYDNQRHHAAWTAPDNQQWQGTTFQGYRRPDGRVGTANHWLVVPLVFCENRNIDCMREAMLAALGYGHADPYRQLVSDMVSTWQQGGDIDALSVSQAVHNADTRLFPHVDGVQFLRHSLGCGGDRGDAQSLCNLLAGYICHPNVAGATVLSLGCQNAQVQLLQDAIAARQKPLHKPLLVFEQQQYRSEEQMLSDAIKATFNGLIEANQHRRSAHSLEHLCIGVECGASDGFSGISANPVIGSCIDLLISVGGTGILSEFPELCGVEADIVNRCVDQQTADRFVELIRSYEKHAATVGVSFASNPSPGNIRDGLITDAMKSAGACKKGGTSPVTGVHDYTEAVSGPGLHLLNTPGNDVESTTALVGSGANLVLFSTGLGTPTGNPIAPVIKVSSNTQLAKRMSDIIDFNAGPVIDGNSAIEELGNQLLALCRQTASGDYQTKAQKLGQFDFQPWKRGVSL